jgi:hypothetical protein
VATISLAAIAAGNSNGNSGGNASGGSGGSCNDKDIDGYSNGGGHRQKSTKGGSGRNGSGDGNSNGDNNDNGNIDSGDGSIPA